jgi:hypothetical protein
MRRVLSGLGVALLILMFAPDRACGETAKEVVQKAVDAMGGADTIKKYTAARTAGKGKMSIMGLDIELETTALYQLPDKAKNVMKMEVLGQKVTVTQIVNGDKIKMTANDMEPPLNDDAKAELKESIVLQAVQNLAPLLEDKGFELSLIENPEKVKDKEVVGVLVKAKNIKDTKLFFDKKTNLLVKVERKGIDPMGGGKNVNQEMIFLDHKKFDGITRPVKMEVFMDGKKFMEAEVTEYKHLDKADKKEFDISD